MKNLPVILLILIALSANSQKLPGIQKGSVRAPATIKVDGVNQEWDNKFQAYNNATEVFYTLANDDNKLYLTLQATNKRIITKILNGGASLILSKTPVKSATDAISVSYPMFDKKTRPVIDLDFAVEAGLSKTDITRLSDSAAMVNNERMIKSSKFIKVKGVKDLDSLVSIYNTDGFKAAASMDSKSVYTYELSVDLKLAGLAVKPGDKLFYKVALNRIPFDEVPGIKVERGADGTILSINIIKEIASTYGETMVTTDFMGEYVMAK